MNNDFKNIFLLMVITLCLVVVPVTVSAQQTSIPGWIKNIAGFWADDQTSDDDFVNAIEYLIGEGIINVKTSTSNVDVDSITIGFIPTEKADELNPKAEELSDFLEERLGVEVNVVVPTNYEIIIEGMRFGHIDAAFMDTGPGWIAHQRSGAEVVMAEVVSGKVNYQATIWANADDDSIHSLEDTIGKRVAFTSITGSSGFVRPMGSLVANDKISIQGDDLVALEAALANSFESYTFAGGYKAALELLLNDNVDVAFGSDIAPAKYLTLEQQGQLRAVTTIGPVPSHVFMVNGDMPESTKNALVDAMIELNDEQNNQILKNIYGADALLPTTTIMHIGEFGTYIDALTGLDQKILDKYNLQK